MGVHYAIVHDETREAYDLGKGTGWQWRAGNEEAAAEDGCPWPPASREKVHAFLVKDFAGIAAGTPVGLARLADEVWAFIQAHPGCRVESDTGDIGWSRPEFLDDEDRADPCRFVSVGSIYDALATDGNSKDPT